MSWDDEDFEPALPVPAPSLTNKWADEEEIVSGGTKESWEDDEPAKPAAEPAKAPKEKKEKKAGKKDSDKDKDKAQPDALDPEVAKRLREKAVLAADMEAAKDMFAGVDAAHLIDTLQPKDEKDFEALAELLAAKVTVHEKSAYYRGFLRSLLHKLCAPLRADDVKELGAVVSVIANEKLKADKPAARKKKGVTAAAATAKKVVPATATRGAAATTDDFDDEDLEKDVRYDEYDSYDFM